MSVTKIMADSEYLRECQDLFELYVSDYIMLTRCKVRTYLNLPISLNCARCKGELLYDGILFLSILRELLLLT